MSDAKTDESEQEPHLARKLINISYVLTTQLYPELVSVPEHELDGPVNTWHVKHPNFGRLELSILGYDVSEALNGLAQRTSELVVNMILASSTLEDEFGYIPPLGIFEVNPPDGSEGLAFTLYVPLKMPDSSPQTIRKLREYDGLNLDLLGWHDTKEERPYASYRFKKENVLLGLIERDALKSLNVAYWLISGLCKAKDVSVEEIFRPN